MVKLIHKKKNIGFTIVELLIVIVVIAILAAISIVAYTGIQNRAHDTSVQTDMRQLGSAITQFIVINDRHPTFAELEGLGARYTKSAYLSDHNSAIYCRNVINGVPIFSVAGLSSSGTGYYYSSQAGSVKEVSTWNNGNAVLCPTVEIPTSGSYSHNWVHSYTNGWLGWTANY